MPFLDPSEKSDFERAYFRNPGIMSRKILEFDWDQTPLGALKDWPGSLKLYLAQIMNQDFPQLIFWGPEFIQIHNEGYIHYLPFPADEKNSIGIYPKEYWGELWSMFEPIVQNVYKNGIPFFQTGVEVQEFRSYKNPGPTFWDISIGPLVNEFGQTQGVFVNNLETTEKILLLKKLEEQEKKINLILDAAEVGYYEVDEQRKEFFFSPISEKIFGFTNPPLISDFGNLIHPNDRLIRQKNIEENQDSGLFEYTVRFTNKEPNPWIYIKGQRFFDQDQKTYRIIGIAQDVTQLKGNELELLESNKKLALALAEQEILQQQKDEFLQIASHELRSPLTSIKGYGQLVEEILVEKGFSQEVQMLDKLNTRVEHLHALVNMLFDVSKINSGKLDLKPIEFDLTDLLKSILLDMRLSSMGNPVSQNLLTSAMVKADKDRISQVINNILTNAQKYSKPGKEIAVSSRIQGEMVQVLVKDYGLGIPEEDLEKIFGQFYRSRNNPILIGGLGLGLHLSYQIIRAHGGSIWAESKLGKGSTFYFTLPLINNFTTQAQIHP